ncbi:MAG: NUDIX domain-containing protein [Candidatus Nanoarchaeia archaeon]|nr:NUDIX domain-containing protein [Candidatus Nanoarchaeia archaeon]
MKSRLIVSAVIEKGDYLLFGKKRKNIGPYPNTWHLIGGGVDIEGESCKEAIVREIEEEAGIKVKITGELGFDEDYEKDKHNELTHYIFLIYRAEYISGNPNADDDLTELKWIKKNKLREILLNKPSIKLFKSLGYI